jgi:hypothetical protein
MIKKPTLVVLLCAVVLGGVVYYLNKKSGAAKTSDDAAKPAFTIDSSDITSLTLSHPAASGQPPVQIVKRDATWQIVQPMETGADSGSVQAILDGLASSRVAQTESGAPDRLKAYGLDPPQVSLDFQLKSGAKHTLAMGNADFSGDLAYSIVDGSKTVSLLPKSLYTSLDKSFDDLRDHAVLHIDPAQVASFDLKNSSGEFAVAKGSTKDATTWNFTKPADTPADETVANALLSAIESAKATAIVSEKPDDSAKDGLANPSITFTAVNGKSEKSTLVIGKMNGTNYFARDLSRPQIFTIDADLYKKLGETFADLRDKKVAHFDQEQINRAELHDTSGTMIISHKEDAAEEWTFELPADQKGKAATAWKIFAPVDALRAEEVLDHPPANITAALAKPEIEVILTDKAGKALTLQISKESGDFVYARTSDGPTVYKLKKQVLDDLNLKPADLAP